MRALAPLSLVMLAGCWPLIPGSWDDYDTPDETQIIGAYSWYEYQGAYWSDDEDFGSAWWAWLEQPDAEITTQKLFHASTTGCQKGGLNLGWLEDRYVDVGTGEAQIQHPNGRVTLDFDDDARRFVSTDLTKADVVADAQYDLVALPVDGAPAYAEGFVSLPAPLDYEGPELDGERPEEVTPEELEWTWSGADASGQTVVIEAILVDADNVELESVTCIAEGSAGRIVVTPTFWDALDDADGWFVFQSNYREAHVRIESETEGLGSSRMAGVRGKIGFLELN